MSLINDALKQANKAHKAQPREASTGANMEPVQPQPGGSKIALILALLLLPLLGGAGWFLGQWWQYQKNAAKPVTGVPIHVASAPTKHPAESLSMENAGPPPADPLIPTPIAPPVETFVEPPKPAPKPVEAAPVETTPAPEVVKPVVKKPDPPKKKPTPPKPKEDTTKSLIPVVTTPPIKKADTPFTPAQLEPFPELKVTYIYASKRDPMATINGHMGVHVNELVDGVRVVKIESMKITVTWRGQTNVVPME